MTANYITEGHRPMTPDTFSPEHDTLPDFEAVRIDEQWCWLWIGEHRPCVEPVECNAPGSEALS